MSPYSAKDLARGELAHGADRLGVAVVADVDHLGAGLVVAGRFVVQIGAFAEASAVRDVRGKAEKAGLATFTQTVNTADGQRTRVRVGPFASREEAEKAAAQAKAAGLGSSVLTL